MRNTFLPFMHFRQAKTVLLTGLVMVLSACGSNTDDEDNNNGYIQFYNGSSNAPAIYLTIDENLDEDDDDEVEITYSAVSYGIATSLKEVEPNDYFFELAWQSEDSTDRSDLTIIYEDQLKVKKEAIQMVVLSDSITAPQVTVYEIEVIDDDNDTDEDLFNVRFLNTQDQAVDVYVSQSNETFNEAVLIGQFSSLSLSDNLKYEQNEYLFYITASGETDVLYQSSEVDFSYPSQYVMVIRESHDASSSPFTLDRVSSSSTIEYVDANSTAQFQIYNGITTHDLIPSYQDIVDVNINGNSTTETVAQLSKGQFSQPMLLANGDYSFDVLVADSDETLMKNHLLTLPEQSSKSVFLYLREDDVDHDNDGDVDEDGDGIVDEIEITISSLVVNNSVSDSIYAHDIALVNLVDSDEFSLVQFYFVRSDETIETADYHRSVSYPQADAISLRNNTYQVFAVAEEKGSQIILAQMTLTLDEASTAMFLIAQQDMYAPTGYSLTLEAQND